jgi:outer membrane assembly lipoprotein YfiO
MVRRATLIILVFLLGLGLAGLSFADEVFEPEAGREFSGIEKSLDGGEIGFSKAIRRYRRLIKRYPKTAASARAQYTIGELFEKLEKKEEAVAAYTVVLDDYQKSECFLPATGDLYRIGCDLFKSELEGVFVNTYEKSRKVFNKLLEVAPYSEYAGEIQYKAGVCSMKLGDYIGAASEFQTVIRDYGKEPWLEKASYQLGVCYFKQSLPAERDQAMTDKAIGELLRFREKYPESGFISGLDEKLSILKERKARSLYLTCLFYWKQKQETASLFYFRELVRRYPDSEWADAARGLVKEESVK